MQRFTAVFLPVLILAGVAIDFEELPAAEPAVSFERDVRPILKTHCFHCHGEEKELQGELDLRLQRFMLRGGESGPAVVPGKPAESLLVERMRRGEMPPEDVESRPTKKDIAIIEKWIAAGAKVVGKEPEKLAPGIHISEAERLFWAFQPVVRPAVPAVKNRQLVNNAIDQFLLAKLEAKGLTLNPTADRRALLRRVYLGLTGLPPEPAEAELFLNDRSPNAYERLVERVLNSPHYGERWGRHWLDVAGYADSEGYTDADTVRPDAHKYRDYVIRAHNLDKPFRQFLVEQLVGDELAGLKKPYNDKQVEQLIFADGS